MVDKEPGMTEIDPTNTNPFEPPPATGSGSFMLALGGMAAAFGAASCCGLPFVLASAGLGTAWLTGIAMLAAPHRSALLIVGAFGPACGAWLLWRQPLAATCADRAGCARPAARGLTLIGLPAGTALLYRGHVLA